MNTTWAVILWSVPSYIPQAYPIIRYEIGYHVLDNCSMADVDDINIQVLNRSNVSSDSTFINITGLSDNTCYIFGVRAYTVNGYGEWTIIANETLLHLAVSITSNICVTPTHSGRVYLVIFINIASLIIVVTLTNVSDSSVIVLGVLVGVLFILLMVSIVIIIFLIEYVENCIINKFFFF